MTQPKSALATHLEQSLGSAKIPGDARLWGETLLDRLKAPVQIVVMGAAGSGKSTLINMLTGEPAIPSLAAMPVIEIAGGDTHRVVFELEDGSLQNAAGTLDNATLPAGTVRARQELPDETLRGHNFVEINLTGGPDQQAAILEWAIERANIILWCTQDFTVQEQQIWDTVPDALKDHSFLVLTKADRQLMKGVLPAQIDALEETVAEEFLCLYPVATIQAIAAQSSEQRQNASLWKSSGGKALCDAVMHLVETGRAADADQASMFISRFAPELVRDTAPAGPAKQEVTQPGNDLAAPAGQTAVVRQGATRVATLDGQNSKLMEDALSLLQAHADQMLGALTGDDAQPDTEMILEQCVQAANALSDIMQDAEPDDPSTRDLQDDAQESAEMMLLFQLERDEDAAADAVTLLLQLKKEVAERAIG